MNIYAVHQNPVIAARSLCDKHLSKMAVASCQMLSTALIKNNINESKLPLTQKGRPYKKAFPDHPCTIWVGETQANYRWLCLHALALTTEYKKRYKKIHTSRASIQQLCGLIEYIPIGEQTPFVRAINKYEYPILNDEKTWGSVVLAYRAYYMLDKRNFAKWGEGRNPPVWWNPDFKLEVKQ